jgi:hypothetical protein
MPFDPPGQDLTDTARPVRRFTATIVKSGSPTVKAISGAGMRFSFLSDEGLCKDKSPDSSGFQMGYDLYQMGVA